MITNIIKVFLYVFEKIMYIFLFFLLFIKKKLYICIINNNLKHKQNEKFTKNYSSSIFNFRYYFNNKSINK